MPCMVLIVFLMRITALAISIWVHNFRRQILSLQISDDAKLLAVNGMQSYVMLIEVANVSKLSVDQSWGRKLLLFERVVIYHSEFSCQIRDDVRERPFILKSSLELIFRSLCLNLGLPDIHNFKITVRPV